eukprot:scaffold415533_cov20-Prasinocladus_malaysianus.AAC.1
MIAPPVMLLQHWQRFTQPFGDSIIQHVEMSEACVATRMNKSGGAAQTKLEFLLNVKRSKRTLLA